MVEEDAAQCLRAIENGEVCFSDVVEASAKRHDLRSDEKVRLEAFLQGEDES